MIENYEVSEEVKSNRIQIEQEMSGHTDMLKQLGKPLSEMTYFYELAKKRFVSDIYEQTNQRIIILGTSFPAEEVYSFAGEIPLWIVGGSRAANEGSDCLLPRDADPVTRSILGQVLEFEKHKEQYLVIVPFISDSQRKMAFLLKSRGWKVTAFEYHPEYRSAQGKDTYEKERCKVRNEIALHLKKRPSKRNLQYAKELWMEIQKNVHAFQKAAVGNMDIFPGLWRMFVLQSFYMAEDWEQWKEHLVRLTRQLEKKRSGKQCQSYAKRPGVLLVGSPILAPGYKIPMLLHEAEIDIYGNIDSSIVRLEYQDTDSWNECAGAFTVNQALWNISYDYVKAYEPDGIIWHVLKGQIEYDFELLRLEKQLEKLAIPVFRVETDYQYQDIEQLRIRMEAFGELMGQQKQEVTERAKIS